MRTLGLLLVSCYRVIISPLKPSCCRYIPTCSDYAHQALHTHGFFWGGWLTLRRLTRCHPWGGHGLDEVPPPRTQINTQQER